MIAARVIRTTGSVTTKRAEYYHRDALGSVEVITDALGRIVRRFHYLPFGERTDITAFAHLDPSYPTASGVAALVKRGYTGHEQLDDFGLIHMNGRIYDVKTARFTSADPHIQYATSTQNHNRYAYVQNNPLKYTDPSGYFLKKLWKGIKDNLRTIVAIAVVAFVPAAWGLVGTMLAGFTSGLIASGGDIRAGLWGAVAGAAFSGIGRAMGDGHKFLSRAHLQKVVAHGGTGGLMSVAQGGKFGHGALASGFAQFAAPGIDLIGKGVEGMHAGRTAVASLVGGTATSLGGGKFANGAITAAFSRAFNDEAHSISDRVRDYFVDNSEVRQCMSQCLTDRYGEAYELASELSPLSLSGAIVDAGVKELDHRLQRSASRHSYGDSKNLPLGRSPTIARRQFSTLQQLRAFNGVQAVAGAGAFGFQFGALGHCAVECW